MRITKMVITIISALCALVAVGHAGVVDAYYPEKPIRVIVPYTPGSVPDVLARLFTQEVSARMTISFVIDNRPGAAGNRGNMLAARANSDGYTLLVATSSTALNPFIYPDIRYDGIRDFAPIAAFGRVGAVLVVAAHSDAASLDALIESGKRPGKGVLFGSGGVGSLAHLSGEAFRRLFHLRADHVPYKGAPETIVGLLGSEVHYAFPTLPTALPYIREERLRAFAVTTENRSAVLPSLPTIRQIHKGGFVLDAWYGLFAPSGTSNAILQYLNSAIRQAMQSPRIGRLASDGTMVQAMSVTEFRQYVSVDLNRWRQFSMQANIRFE